jgi:DNA-binding SARP family transcriptional activator
MTRDGLRGIKLRMTKSRPAIANGSRSHCHKADLPPLTSLIRKSEKAQQKLTPGTWQHTMLQENLEALRLAERLLNEEAGAAPKPTAEELRRACSALSAMIEKTCVSQSKFAPGTSQHTLQRNRLEALRFAETRIKSALKEIRGGCNA